jgi:Polyketide cyclase / dehydrase and lipid transport
MIARLVRLVAIAGVAAYVIDRVLAARRGERPPAPIQSMVVIEAPIERVWGELADVEGQPRWMTEMKAVRILTPGPIGVGTRGEADVRIAGIGVSDPVEIVEFSPPRRFAIRHEGLFTGGGVIELRAGTDGRTTIATWDETLVPPLLPELGALVQRPILAAIFQADLHRFRELLETPPPGAAVVTGAAGTAGVPDARIPGT